MPEPHHRQQQQQQAARILLVEDEAGIVEVLGDLLRSEGHEVDAAGEAVGALRKIAEQRYDVLILDVMLPGRSGYEICHEARQHGFDGGILMLTARGQVQDRVTGLRTGADDYLVKPFDPEELLARVDALLRRLNKAELTPVMTMKFGEISADFSKGEFRRSGQPLSLSAKEAELLRLLVNHRGQVVSRDTILKQVWKEQPFITPRTVDVHIAWLRQKIEDKADSPKFLQTVRGEGYQFVL